MSVDPPHCLDVLKLNGADFTFGRTRFFESPPGGGEPTPKIFVKILAPGFEEPLFAQLDTGAAWSVLACEVAEMLGLLDGSGEPRDLRTRDGVKTGYLVRVPLI